MKLFGRYYEFEYFVVVAAAVYAFFSPSIIQVENLVAVELAYINTKHPDFTEANLVHKTAVEDTQDRRLVKESGTPAKMAPMPDMTEVKENKELKVSINKFPHGSN